ncbi:hypothetical protein [Pseudotabrizicola sp. 4114]|uniref:hypothetical protein n=1 Tax=Pseudotabrizicola sp. 4114 TaxID=2817731 RepID=UPI00285F135F|nr:hypothetical protein [Pseudorhodobacter sp. 4114]
MPQMPPAATEPAGAMSAAAGTLSIEAVEGRLLAQRKVLALILARMLAQEGGRDLRDALDTLSVMQDHQEDPGAVPDGPERIEGAIAVEIREIVRAALRAQTTMNPDGMSPEQ